MNNIISYVIPIPIRIKIENQDEDDIDVYIYYGIAIYEVDKNNKAGGESYTSYEEMYYSNVVYTLDDIPHSIFKTYEEAEIYRIEKLKDFKNEE